MSEIKKIYASKGVKFTILSGVGWIVDYCIFYSLVVFLNVTPAFSNFVSANFAAILVFFVSQKIIFRVEVLLLKYIVIYIIYSWFNIVISSVLIGYLSLAIFELRMAQLPLAAVIAKMMVTPFSLCINYAVNKLINGVKKSD